MAWRYLVARKKGNGLSFMTTVSISGIALGVAALVIVLSVMGGFERDLKGKMLRGSPHLEIFAENTLAGFALKDHPLEWFQQLFAGEDGVEAFTQADVAMEHGKFMSSGVVFGIDPEGGGLWSYKGSMVEGDLSAIGQSHLPLLSLDESGDRWPGIVLGDKLARQLGAEVGDEINLISASAMVSSSAAMAGSTLSRRYVVVGIFHTGLFNYDAKWAVVSIDEGRRFLQDYDHSLARDHYVSGVGINALDPIHIERLADKIRGDKRFRGLKTVTWKESNSSLIFALKLEKFSMGSILMLILLVAAFSISGTMMMSVFHKKREVNLLRSLGMSQRQVVVLFLLQAHTIATVGILLGCTLGLSACSLLWLLGSIQLPAMAEILRIFPVKFLPVEYVVICLFAWLLGLIGACYPAWMASRQEPSRGLRY